MASAVAFGEVGREAGEAGARHVADVAEGRAPSGLGGAAASAVRLVVEHERGEGRLRDEDRPRVGSAVARMLSDPGSVGRDSGGMAAFAVADLANRRSAQVVLDAADAISEGRRPFGLTEDNRWLVEEVASDPRSREVVGWSASGSYERFGDLAQRDTRHEIENGTRIDVEAFGKWAATMLEQWRPVEGAGAIEGSREVAEVSDGPFSVGFDMESIDQSPYIKSPMGFEMPRSIETAIEDSVDLARETAEALNGVWRHGMENGERDGSSTTYDPGVLREDMHRIASVVDLGEEISSRVGRDEEFREDFASMLNAAQNMGEEVWNALEAEAAHERAERPLDQVDLSAAWQEHVAGEPGYGFLEPEEQDRVRQRWFADNGVVLDDSAGARDGEYRPFVEPNVDQQLHAQHEVDHLRDAVRFKDDTIVLDESLERAARLLERSGLPLDGVRMEQLESAYIRVGAFSMGDAIPSREETARMIAYDVATQQEARAMLRAETDPAAGEAMGRPARDLVAKLGIRTLEQEMPMASELEKISEGRWDRVQEFHRAGLALGLSWAKDAKVPEIDRAMLRDAGGDARGAPKGLAAQAARAEAGERTTSKGPQTLGDALQAAMGRQAGASR